MPTGQSGFPLRASLLTNMTWLNRWYGLNRG